MYNEHIFCTEIRGKLKESLYSNQIMSLHNIYYRYTSSLEHNIKFLKNLKNQVL